MSIVIDHSVGLAAASVMTLFGTGALARRLGAEFERGWRAAEEAPPAEQEFERAYAHLAGSGPARERAPTASGDAEERELVAA